MKAARITLAILFTALLIVALQILITVSEMHACDAGNQHACHSLRQSVGEL